MDENKKMFVYFGMIFASVLLTYKLPYETNSMIEYVIRPIIFGDGKSSLHLAGLVPLTLFVVAILGLFKLKRFSSSKILLLLIIFIAVIPAVNWTLDSARAAYHQLRGDDLKAVDIVDADLKLYSSNEMLTIKTTFELINYSNTSHSFHVRIYFPPTIQEHLGIEHYDFENAYVAFGRRRPQIIKEDITIVRDVEAHQNSQLFGSRWHWEDFVIEIFNEKESVTFISRGL